MQGASTLLLRGAVQDLKVESTSKASLRSCSSASSTTGATWTQGRDGEWLRCCLRWSFWTIWLQQLPLKHYRVAILPLKELLKVSPAWKKIM